MEKVCSKFLLSGWGTEKKKFKGEGGIPPPPPPFSHPSFPTGSIPFVNSQII